MQRFCFIVLVFWSCSYGLSVTKLQNYFATAPLSIEAIDSASKMFLGSPYKRSPLNEQVMLSSAFDCQTYVETVLALSISKSLPDFLFNLQKIRYSNNVVSFLTRNHFPSIDWLPNAYKINILQNITPGLPESKKTTTIINKSAWLKSRGFDVKGLKFAKVLYYIPLTSFIKNNHLNYHLLKRLPRAMVVQHVRLNWRPVPETSMHISHMGLLLHKDHRWIYREASERLGKVVEEDFLHLLQRLIKHKKIIGLHLDKVIL